MNVYMFSNRFVDAFDAKVFAEDEKQAYAELKNYLSKFEARHNIDFDMSEFYIQSVKPYVDK